MLVLTGSVRPLARLLVILLVLSLLLGAGVAGLWYASYSASWQFLRLAVGQRDYAVRSTHGRILVYRLAPASAGSVPAVPPPSGVRVPAQRGTLVVSVPHWAIVVPLLVVPAFAIRLCLRCRRWLYRRRHGLCARCGYDLRASPERCPECGTPVPRKRNVGEVLTRWVGRPRAGDPGGARGAGPRSPAWKENRAGNGDGDSTEREAIWS